MHLTSQQPPLGFLSTQQFASKHSVFLLALPQRIPAGPQRLLHPRALFYFLLQFDSPLLHPLLKLIMGPSEGFLALLQISEQQRIGFRKTRLDNGLVDEVKGNDLEIVTDQIGKAIDVYVKCESQFRADG